MPRLATALFATALLYACLAISATFPLHADLVINEIFYNAPGTDDGMEFIELRSTTGGVESLFGLTFLVIEGDGTGAGEIDKFYTFGSSDSTGTNGLLLLRDSATVLSPAPDAATTLIVDSAFFLPDLENGAQTYLLVTGFTGSTTTDLDADNDGVIDVTLPWTTIKDAVAWKDDTVDLTYVPPAFTSATLSSSTAMAILRDFTTGGWIQGSVTGTPTTGPFSTIAGGTYDASGAPLGVSVGLTPGSANPSVAAVPEPSSLALTGLLGLGALLRRRRRPA